MPKTKKAPAKAPDLSRVRSTTRKAGSKAQPSDSPKARKQDRPAPGKKARSADAKKATLKAGSQDGFLRRRKLGPKAARVARKPTIPQDALRAPQTSAPPWTPNGTSEGPIARQGASEAHGRLGGSNVNAARGDPVTFAELIAALKIMGADSAGIAMLADCPPLRALVAAWPAARINRLLDAQDRIAAPKPETPLVEWLRLAWSCVSFDLAVLEKLCGPGIDVRPLVERASGLLLIYPDGTVHPDASRYLNAYAYTTIVKRRKAPGERS